MERYALYQCSAMNFDSSVPVDGPAFLTPAALGINLNTTLGAIFIGLIPSAVLYLTLASPAIGTYLENE